MQFEGHFPGHLYWRDRHSYASFNLQVRELYFIYVHSAFQAVFMHRYFHRTINVQKLVDVGFTYIPRNSTLARMIRLNKLPAVPHLAGAGLREMSERDIPQVAALYTRYMERFTMSPIMDLDELKHMFLSGLGEGPAPKDWAGRREKQVVWAYVVEVCITLSACRGPC